MSLGTYTDLKNSVAKWLARRIDLADVIPDFITLGEARIARDLRLRRQITSATLSAVAGTATVTLPTDWLQFVDVKIDGAAPRTLEVQPLELLDGNWTNAQSGSPVGFAIAGTTLTLGPKPDVNYSLLTRYYARLAALSDAASTNWLLTEHPGLYLWSALAESAPFIVADARIAIWEGKYSAEVAAVRAADSAARFSGSSLRQVAR